MKQTHMTNGRNGFIVSVRTRCSRWRSYNSSPLAFTRQCAEKLGRLGDVAVDARQHDSAIAHYSTALSLDPTIKQYIYIKRSKVYVAKGLWEDALHDASQVCHFYLV